MSGDLNDKMSDSSHKISAQTDELDLFASESGETSSGKTVTWEIWAHNKNIDGPQSKLESCKFLSLFRDIITTVDLDAVMSLITNDRIGANHELIFCRKEMTAARLDPAKGIGVWRSMGDLTRGKNQYSDLDYWKESCHVLMQSGSPGVWGAKIEKLANGQEKRVSDLVLREEEIQEILAGS